MLLYFPYSNLISLDWGTVADFEKSSKEIYLFFSQLVLLPFLYLHILDECWPVCSEITLKRGTVGEERRNIIYSLTKTLINPTTYFCYFTYQRVTNNLKYSSPSFHIKCSWSDHGKILFMENWLYTINFRDYFDFCCNQPMLAILWFDKWSCLLIWFYFNNYITIECYLWPSGQLFLTLMQVVFIKLKILLASALNQSRNTCWFPISKYSHHRQFQDTNGTLVSKELGSVLVP